MGTPQLGRVRTKNWVRVSHGLYRPDDEPASSLGDLGAWALVLPSSGAFTHLTAAGAYGWWLPPTPADLPVFASLAKSEPRPRRSGLRVCQHPQPVASERVRGLPMATPTETLLACARDLGLLDLVVLIDAALHLEHCTPTDIEVAAAQQRRGAPALRRALAWADRRSESAWESALRVLHRACEVLVQPQYEVYDDQGRFVARGDLRILGTHTLHEYDGGEHRTRQRQRHDLRRERGLGAAGWLRRGYTSAEVLGQAHLILREADASLGRPHRPERLHAWYRLLGESLFSFDGTERLRTRWGLAPRD